MSLIVIRLDSWIFPSIDQLAWLQSKEEGLETLLDAKSVKIAAVTCDTSNGQCNHWGLTIKLPAFAALQHNNQTCRQNYKHSTDCTELFCLRLTTACDSNFLDLPSLSTHTVLEKAKGYSLLWSLFQGPQLGWCQCCGMGCWQHTDSPGSRWCTPLIFSAKVQEGSSRRA